LVWGIHVAAHSDFQTLSDLENKKVAISRLGSGSQLMAYVNAKNQGWATNILPFEIVNTLEGAVTALTNGSADYFMWERFMTKPLVYQGVFRRIADCPTPWPCFVIAVREGFLNENPSVVAKILEIINRKTTNFKAIPNSVRRLAATYNQKPEDIEEWLSLTEWSQKNMSLEIVENIQNQLLELGIIDKLLPSNLYIY
jgi:ABC-type nitrate/sulfonate/bicarbonate transport system substrate-binding protein